MNHIVVITTSFPDVAFQAGQEAAGTFVYDFVAELARHVQVTAVAPGSRTKMEQEGSLAIRYFGVPSLPLSLLKPGNPTHWPKILATLRAGQSTVNQVIQQNEVDHLFALWALPSGYWAQRAGAQHQVPYSIWALGSDIWSLGQVPLVRGVLRSVLRHSRYRFADGYQLATDVQTLSGLDCEFLPSTRKLPVTTEKELATAPPYKLAFLGRWHPHKGVDLLLESLQMLSDDDWEKIAEVQICGGGPLQELVHGQCERLRENGRSVSVRGYLDRQEATDLFAWADYLLLPSRIESIPVIFSDAMQTGCPIISTPIGDLPRLLHQYEVGVLATAVDSHALTGAIRKAIGDSPATLGRGLAAAKEVFNMTIAAQQLLTTIST